ncbi:unnamed protein product [Cuscuta campestris]|uniref:RIN4 pathogenic type III effector avirulence factor Avr cleavage site domain-containing protein n=1 Tax=Cuscuta campestris TaxID=132261 RepID=A0A484NNY6_9ASTE|nr:unnamed protein product [Cuscuta campestris]
MFPRKAPRAAAAAAPTRSPSSEHGVLQYEEPPVGYGASVRPTIDKRQMSKDNSDHLNHSNSPPGNGNTMGKKGSFEKSPHHPQYHQGKGRDGRKSNENTRGSTTPGRTHNNNNSNGSSQQGTLGKSYGTPGRSRKKLESPDRKGAAALPKFGEWDEKDSQSADNYSYIFNTHRDERHTDASSNVMRTPTRPRPNRNQDDDDKFQKRCCPWWSKR